MNGIPVALPKPIAIGVTKPVAGSIVATKLATPESFRYLAATGYSLQLRAAGYASDRAVWDAVRETPAMP